MMMMMIKMIIIMVIMMIIIKMGQISYNKNILLPQKSYSHDF